MALTQRGGWKTSDIVGAYRGHKDPEFFLQPFLFAIPYIRPFTVATSHLGQEAGADRWSTRFTGASHYSWKLKLVKLYDPTGKNQPSGDQLVSEREILSDPDVGQ